MKQKPKKTSPNIAPTMTAAAGRLGVAVELLKAAKDAGCDAFRERGSVDCNRLPGWLAEHPEILAGQSGGIPSKSIEQALLLRARRQREEHRLAVERRDYVPTKEVVRTVGRMILSAKQMLLTNVDSITAGATMKCGLNAEQSQSLRQIVSDHTQAALRELRQGKGLGDEPEPLKIPNEKEKA